MSSVKDFLKKSQGGTDRLKLPVVQTFSVKEDGSSISFQRWDKETEKNIFRDDPIQGIYIGGAMKLSIYDDNLGSRGGNYFSSHYVSKDNVTLYEGGKNIHQVFKGTTDQIAKWATDNSTSRAVKKKWCFFVLTANGLIEVQSNISIAIDQIGKNRDGLTEKYIILTPMVYDADTKNVSNKCKDILGKFAQRNPPKYANVELGDEISMEDFETLDANTVIATYQEWKKQLGSNTNVAEVESEIEEKPNAIFEKPERYSTNPKPSGGKEKVDSFIPDPDGDDLPF